MKQRATEDLSLCPVSVTGKNTCVILYADQRLVSNACCTRWQTSQVSWSRVDCDKSAVNGLSGLPLVDSVLVRSVKVNDCCDVICSGCNAIHQNHYQCIVHYVSFTSRWRNSFFFQSPTMKFLYRNSDPFVPDRCCPVCLWFNRK